MFKAARHHLTHASGVVIFTTSNLKFSIIGTTRHAIFENYHAGHRIGARNMRNVIPLNATWHGFKIKELLKLQKCLIGRQIEKFLVGKNNFSLQTLQTKIFITELSGHFEFTEQSVTVHIALNFGEEIVAVAIEVTDEATKLGFVSFFGGFANLDTWRKAEVGVESFLAVIRLIVVGENFTQHSQRLNNSGFSVKRANIGRLII